MKSLHLNVPSEHRFGDKRGLMWPVTEWLQGKSEVAGV